MDLFHHRHGGIHLVVIDGIADLIRSANDETESIAIVDELYRLVGIYNGGKPIYEISVPNRPGGIWVKLQLSDGVVTPLKWKGE